MVNLIEGMTPAEYTAAINQNFTDQTGTGSYNSEMATVNLVASINENFGKSVVSIGQSGASFMANINNEFYGLNVKQREFMQLEFGMNICWFSGTYYDGYPAVLANLDFFTPTAMPDIDEWLDTAVAAGMTYIDMPAKCEDGLCLWPTAFHVDGYGPTSVEYSAWGIANDVTDIVQLVYDGCIARGLKLVLYFSVYDKTYESQSGKTSLTHPIPYNAMIHFQLNELVTMYPNLTAIWIDDLNWRLRYQEIPWAGIFNAVKNIQPNCLVINNEHEHPMQNSQIEVYEPATSDGHVPEGNLRDCEEIVSIRTDGKWWWRPGDDQTAAALMTKEEILVELNRANSRHSNYVLAICPDDAGKLTSAQKSILLSLNT